MRNVRLSFFLFFCFADVTRKTKIKFRSHLSSCAKSLNVCRYYSNSASLTASRTSKPIIQFSISRMTRSRSLVSRSLSRRSREGIRRHKDRRKIKSMIRRETEREREKFLILSSPSLLPSRRPSRCTSGWHRGGEIKRARETRGRNSSERRRRRRWRARRGTRKKKTAGPRRKSWVKESEREKVDKI